MTRKEYKLWSMNEKWGNKELLTMYGETDKEIQNAYVKNTFKQMLEFKEKENITENIHHVIKDENGKIILDILF